jgi:4-hydroxybenzoate polyprenyltransferase
MSSRELIIRYVRERARLGVFVPLALVMAAMGGWTGTAEYALAALTALLLVLAGRVWDDLEDRGNDAGEHPRRVTVVATSVAPLIALAFLGGALGALLVGIGPHAGSRLAAVGSAIVVLAAWYRMRSASPRPMANAHVVLLKYPLLTFAATPAPPPPGALAALYLVLCVYEIVDDPALRASIAARWIAISECALVSVIIATATLFRGKIP